MRFLCPLCSFTISMPDDALKKRIACPNCKQGIVSPASNFDPGCVIGDFVIQQKLGEGSIGAVYKARQISLERVVALKVLSSDHMTQRGMKEFLREARSAAKLTHANLVQSYAVGVESNYCYMAMTYITGETLRARIQREGRIPVDESLHIVQQVAEALHYAWTEQRLIHRDVKPDNIMLSAHGVVKLTDLGLAMNQAEWTEHMAISGSPSYMSPEQFAGEKLDTRSDIYSLGVTLYQMLTGDLPFDANTVRSVAKQHFEMKVPDLAGKVPGIPAEVEKCVKKMLAKVPDNRFKDMDDLLKNIWKIRQKTAPKRELVPDVHTISLRRLDYTFQELNQASAEGETQIRPVDLNPPVGERQKSWSVAFFVLLSLTAIVMTLAFLLLVKYKRLSDNPDRLFYIDVERDVANLEALIDDNSLSKGEKQLAAARIMQKIEGRNRQSVQDRAVLEYVRSLASPPDTSERVPKEQFVEMQRKLAQMQQEHDGLLEQLNALDVDYNALKRDYKNDGEKWENEVKYWQGQVTDLQQNLATEQEKSNARMQQYLSFVQDYYGAMLCKKWSDRDIQGAENLIQESTKILPGMSLWFDQMNELHQLCKNLSNLLPSGKKELNDMSIDNLFSLIFNQSDTFPIETRTKAAFEIIRGNYGAACRQAPEESDILNLISGVCRYEAFLLKVNVLKLPFEMRQRQKLDDFKRVYEGAPSFPQCYEMLLPLFPEQTMEPPVKHTGTREGA